MPDDSSAAQVSAAWQEAVRQLHIEIVAPFEVAGVMFAAHLPDFGGPQGMVITGLTSTEGSATHVSR